MRRNRWHFGDARYVSFNFWPSCCKQLCFLNGNIFLWIVKKKELYVLAGGGDTKTFQFSLVPELGPYEPPGVTFTNISTDLISFWNNLY